MNKVKTKPISTHEANEFLAQTGMRIGDWNQLARIDGVQPNWISHVAPKDAARLLCFSQHVAAWLPKGKWKILQIDNSSCLDIVQENYMGRLLFGPEHLQGLNGKRTFVFEFGKNQNDDNNTELLIADLIFAFLLVEGHAYLISSGSKDGANLGIQDGSIYFSAKDERVHRANTLLENYAQAPLKSPSWVVEMIMQAQEQDINE